MSDNDRENGGDQAVENNVGQLLMQLQEQNKTILERLNTLETRGNSGQGNNVDHTQDGGHEQLVVNEPTSNEPNQARPALLLVILGSIRDCVRQTCRGISLKSKGN